MNKNWENTIIEVTGTLTTNKNGEFEFKCSEFNQRKRYSATFKVASDSPWAVLSGRNTFVTIDCLTERDVDAIKTLEKSGEINNMTRLVVSGHLVRTPGKPGMNDLFNLKKRSIRPAEKNENHVINFDEALTKDEWQVIYKEKQGRNNAPSVAPSAPIAPSAPV